jgi:hypothetical protein
MFKLLAKWNNDDIHTKLIVNCYDAERPHLQWPFDNLETIKEYNDGTFKDGTYNRLAQRSDYRRYHRIFLRQRQMDSQTELRISQVSQRRQTLFKIRRYDLRTMAKNTFKIEGYTSASEIQRYD